MKADQIRKLADPKSRTQTCPNIQIVLLAEIAAQIAEVNKHIARLSSESTLRVSQADQT